MKKALVLLLSITLLIVPILYLWELLLLQPALAAPLDAINANVPLRAAILAYYSLPDRELTDELCEEIKARNTNPSQRDFAMDLSGAKDIESLSGIEVLDSLGVTELYLSGLKAPFASGAGWGNIAGISGLKLLEAESCGITALPDLGKLANLRQLYLRNNSIGDISGIAACKALAELDLSGNPVSDFSPLAGMNGLQQLSIGGAKATGWDFLAGKGSLTELSISNAGFSDADWQHIAGMAKLQQLALPGNNLTSAQPLKLMKEAGNLPGLQVASLEHNFIGEWATALPTGLGGIQLTPASKQQYCPAVLLGGVAVDSISLGKDTSVTIAKRLIGGGNTVNVAPAAVNSSAGNMVVKLDGANAGLSPRQSGDALLSVRLLDGAINEANVSLTLPVSIQGGGLTARLQLTAGGRSVYHEYEGLFADTEVELAAPSRDECARLFQAVGIDLDDYEMPDPNSARVTAGQTATLVFPPISTGSITLRHVMDNGDEMAREQIGKLAAGSYTYQPRTDIPGYTSISQPQTVRISHSNRSPELTFRYKYDRQKAQQAADNAQGGGGIQGGVHSPALPFQLKGESQAMEAGTMIAEPVSALATGFCLPLPDRQEAQAGQPQTPRRWTGPVTEVILRHILPSR